MAPLGALSQAWTAAEASLPLGWRMSGLMRYGEDWIVFSNGPADTDHLEATGGHAAQALRLLADKLRERRGVRSSAGGGFVTTIGLLGSACEAG